MQWRKALASGRTNLVGRGSRIGNKEFKEFEEFKEPAIDRMG